MAIATKHLDWYAFKKKKIQPNTKCYNTLRETNIEVKKTPIEDEVLSLHTRGINNLDMNTLYTI